MAPLPALQVQGPGFNLWYQKKKKKEKETSSRLVKTVLGVSGWVMEHDPGIMYDAWLISSLTLFSVPFLSCQN